jgi:hypothetical protein
MLVPTMTPEEICNEIYLDSIDIMRMFNVKATYTLKEKARTKNFRWVETIHLKSRKQNHWSIAVDFSESAQHCSFYLKAEDKTGLVAYSWFFKEKVPIIIRYNPHFFRRYRERMQLEEVNPHQIMKRFFKQNTAFTGHYSEKHENGTMMTAFRMKEGMGLGRTWADTHVIEVKTFLPHHMLSKSQAELANQLLNDEKVFVGLDFEEFRRSKKQV